MSDPLRWWPGKYADCKRIAHLVEEFLPRGEVLEAGGPGVFGDLLPAHSVTWARIADGVDLCRLPFADDAFDVGVSARVLELLPPRMRAPYLRELVRTCRFRTFVALPVTPELEAIDKIKNVYVWDTSRVWQHPGPRPDDLEQALEELGVEVTFHIEPPRGVGGGESGSCDGWIETFLASPAGAGSAFLPGVPTPTFVVAEIAKAEPVARPLVASPSAH